MTVIKKAHQPIINLLNANPGALVSDILDQAIELAQAKSGGGGGKATTFHKIEGTVVAIKCYYHKLWMDPAVVEFGSKASSTTGLNSMCKDGTSKWTKQQRVAKLAKEQLLQDLAAGDIEAAELPDLLASIEADQNHIDSEGAIGYDSLEECLASQE